MKKTIIILLSILGMSATSALTNLYAENLIPYNAGNGKWGYCDSKSDVKIKPQYDAAWPFRDGVAAALKQEYTIFISTDGTEIFRGRWQNTGMADRHGAPIQLRGLWGYAGKDGELLFPAEYDAFYNFSADLAPVKKDGKWGFVNLSTREFVPCGCDEIQPFSEGYAVFERNGKFGFFDENGKEAAPPVYEELYSFSNGFATARMNGNYGFITKELFFKEKDYIRIWPFSHGYAAAESLASENKCGYINSAAKIAVPFVYAECQPFSEGYAAVRKTKDGKWGYIDSKGNEVSQFRYDKAYPITNGAAWTVIGRKGAWINPQGRPYDKFYNLKKIRDDRQ